jgi:hypothetical protein
MKFGTNGRKARYINPLVEMILHGIVSAVFVWSIFHSIAIGKIWPLLFSFVLISVLEGLWLYLKFWKKG